MEHLANNAGAIILAGGKSTRMGTAKAQLQIGEGTMLERVTHILHALLDTVVVVGAPHQTFPLIAGQVIWTHDVVGDEGPLRGLQAGLMALPHHVERVFVTGCDTPLLKPAFLTQLFGLCKDIKAVVPNIAGVPQPLTAVYATDILPVITEMLEDGQRSLQALIRRIDTHFVSEDVVRQVDPDLDSFENVNTPADYHRILKRI
jgi:molybdopterin-guanine dinucleotide biosynthesis protein A